MTNTTGEAVCALRAALNEGIGYTACTSCGLKVGEVRTNEASIGDTGRTSTANIVTVMPPLPKETCDAYGEFSSQIRIG